MDETPDEKIAKRNLLSYVSPKDNPVGFIAFLFVAFLAFGALSVAVLNPGGGESRKNPNEENKTESTFKTISKHTLIYGFWSGNSSKINAANLDNGKIYELADLPSNIKKVTLISGRQLIFISQTDDRDHGKEISSYDTAIKETKSVITAEPLFGIDDYVISPNKRYIATWEVSIPAGAESLLGGLSRIYSIDLQNPTVKNLIFDEGSIKDSPVHYPLAILDNGDIYMDQMEPNTGYMWARGMSQSNFDGSVKGDITSMSGGTFGTQPAVSNDGTKFAFGGYSASPSTGRNRFAQAILNANTVEILDTATKTRVNIGAAGGNKYLYVAWDPLSNKMIYGQINSGNLTFYSYDPESSQSKKLIDTKKESSIVIAGLDSEKFLLTRQSVSESNLGNLGPKYGFLIKNFEIGNASGATERLALPSSLNQYIAILPAGFVAEESLTQAGVIGQDGKIDQGRQLQLETFTIKPSLAPKRISQQSKIPDIPDYSGYEPFIVPDLSSYPPVELGFTYTPAADCKPVIYLYPETTMPVNVKIPTALGFTKTDPVYPSLGWNVIADPNGNLFYGTTNYPYLYYEAHVPDSLLEKPNEGYVVQKDELRALFARILPKLGLNLNETIEFSNYWVKALPDSPFYLVRIIPQSNIEKLFPFNITPKPDSVVRVNVHFEALDQRINVKEPILSTPARNGFTVAEWGGLFKRDAESNFTCLE